MQLHPIETIAFDDGNFPNLDGDHLLTVARFLRVDFRRLLFESWAKEREPILNLLKSQEFSPSDRFAIQEWVQMAEWKRMLEHRLGLPAKETMRYLFEAPKNHPDMVEQATYAAGRERERLNLGGEPVNIFGLLNHVGVSVFRRKLEDPRISSLFFRHPSAGMTVLVNRVEDHSRERFSAAHEYAHILLDPDIPLHLTRLGGGEWFEARANVFAANLLLPASAFEGLEKSLVDDPDRLVETCQALAQKYLVNGMVALMRFIELGWIPQERIPSLMSRPELRTPLVPPFDPVLPFKLPDDKKKAFEPLGNRGISWEYMSLVCKAYREALISRAKMGELLFMPEQEAFQHGREVGLL